VRKVHWRKSIGLLAIVTAVGVDLGSSGCASRTEKAAVLTAESSNLKPLSILYGQYQARNENRPPANEADFKRFIQANGQSLLNQFNTDIDRLFVSPRDGQPYVVYYRDMPLPPSGVVAHERDGIDGKRLVAFPFGGVEIADEMRFGKLVPQVDR
jgi:hypothetical protein